MFNAKNVPLNTQPGSLPNMSGTIQGWFQPMTFQRVTSQNVDGIIYENLTDVKTQGVRQPMTARQLMVKPEGERSWKWETMHCLPDVILQTGEVIKFHDIPYRVMQVWDWREYGFREYHVVRDFDKAAG